MSYNLQHLLSTVLRNRAVALPPANKFAGAWGIRSPWLDGSTVLDQRTGLGTPRPPEPRRCLELNGTNQYGWIPIDPVTEFPFTIFGWANTAVEAASYLFSLSGTSSSNIKMSFAPQRLANTARLARGNTTEFITDITVGNLLNSWKSYVLIFQSSTAVDLYINGVLVQSLTGLDAVNLGTVFNRFGFASFHATSPSAHFNGRAMHCGFLRRAATLADAQTFHTTGIIPDAEVLLPLDGNSTTVAHNIGTSAAHWLEEPRRNLLGYTENLNVSPWLGLVSGAGLQPVVTVETAPDGTQTAWRIDCNRVGDTINDRSEMTQTVLSAVTNGTQATGSFWVKAATPSDVGKQFAWRHVGSAAYSSFTLTANWVKITLTQTSAGLGNNWAFGSRATFNADAQVSFVVWQPQLELGSTATEYQPVLRTGIDYPEATIVNGAAGMLYEGRDVPFSRQNEVGFSERRNLLDSTSTLNVTPWSGAVRDTAVLQPDGGWKLVGFSDAAGVRLSQQQEGSPLTTYTAQVEVRAEGTDIGKAFLLMLIRSGLTTSVLEQTVVNLTADYQLVTVTWTGLADTEGYQIRFNFPTGGADAPIVRNPQVELGSVATSYQRIDSDPGTSVRIPALLSDPAKSAATDTLTYTGKAHFDGALEQSNCLTGDGVDDLISTTVAINDYPFTIATRIRPTNVGTVEQAIGVFFDPNNYLAFGKQSSNPPVWRVTRRSTTSGFVSTNIGGQIVPGQWYQTTIVFHSDTSFSLYLDGVLVQTITGDTSVPITSGSLLRLFNVAAGPFEGSLADVWLFAKELTPSEIAEQDWLSYDPILHIPCSEGHGNQVHDTINNQAYPIVNGQASNWETKQDNYNYNITKGATKIDTSASENFDPATLVLSDETSIGIDPSDFTHLFQDAAGTIPVTQVGDPIGLALDQQEGGLNNLGPELVTNPTASLSGDSGIDVGTALTIGRSYLVQFTVTNYSGSGDVGFVGGTNFASIAGVTRLSGNGTARGIATAVGSGNVRIFTRATNSATFSNISVREVPGYHLSQTDNAKRPILSRTPEGGVRNLLQWTEAFDNAYWTKANSTVVANVAANPINGTLDADRMTTSASFGEVRSAFTYPSTGTYTLKVYAKSETLPQLILRLDRTTNTANVTLTFATETVVTSGANIISGSATSVGDGWYLIKATANVVDTAFVVGYTGGSATGSVLLWGAQIEKDATDTPYQKATTLFDITEAGKRDCWAIGFPGNAALSTPASVDMSGSDEMTVCVGLRKFSDATQGIVAETSNSITVGGTVSVNAPAGAGLSSADYAYQSNGTSLASAVAADGTKNAPIANVLTGISKISAPSCVLRLNGTEIQEVTTSQGSGNYSNNRIYFGSRAESSLFFNGLMYSCVIINRLLTDFERERLENWSAYKQGAANFHIIEPLFVPASQTNLGFDSLENPLTNPAIVGHNGAETEINFSPVDNSWPEQYSIPGADLPNYTFDGDPGDIVVRVDTPTREGSFRLEK